MDNYETKCIALRKILGSYLSDTNKLMPLWHYGILLPKTKKILAYPFH